MSGDRARRTARARGRRLLPTPALSRTTDRVEDLVAWLLVSLGLLAVLGAVLVGLAAHGAALRLGGLGDGTRVRVELLADAPAAAVAPRRVPAPLPSVPVSWTDSDGVEQIGELVVRAPLRAGTEVTAWVDRHGRLTSTAPEHAPGAAAFGIGAALTAGAVAAALLTALWSGARRMTAAHNDAAWTREWARVEPVWRRQVR